MLLEASLGFKTFHEYGPRSFQDEQSSLDLNVFPYYRLVYAALVLI